MPFQKGLKIIQFYIAGYDFKTDMNAFLKNVQRVLSAFFEFAILKKFSISQKILKIIHQINYRDFLIGNAYKSENIENISFKDSTLNIK